MTTTTQEGESGIRTPDQRLRVFVSSTLAELADERGAVSRAVSTMGLTPVLFELGARPHPPQELYRAYLAQSDIFVGLYWQRYGWVGAGMDISGLEDEFRLSTSMPRLLYVKTPAPDREQRLTDMIGELQTDGTEAYRSFSSPDELERLVRDDLAVLLSERFAAMAAPRPVAAPAPPQASLPSSSTSFVGREHDVEAVAAFLESPDVRLVSLTGPGGIGKTRLAIAVGERLDGRYQRGTVFVPLSSITEPALAVSRIASALGTLMEGTRSPLDAVIEQLADDPTLLVLDNLEQVVSVAPDLDTLLTHCPRLVMLTTSRTILRLRAERREYPVAPLPLPDPTDVSSPDALAELPALQLFVDRARAVRYDFALTNENVAAVAEIARRLDGLPLAIELAAARVRLLTPEALLRRLEQSVDALGTGPVDLPERQRTLRATVEWSIDLLDETECEMLAAMSTFVDGWTIDAASHVADLDEDAALDLLDALAAHSLIAVDATHAEPRFRMLQSIREIVGERLVGESRRLDLARRHAQFFGEMVERDEWPKERQYEWTETLLANDGNVRLAIRWYFDHEVRRVPHILRILWLFWQMLDRMPEGQAFMRELLGRADELDERERVELYFTAAATATEVGDDESALASVAAIADSEAVLDDLYLTSATHLIASWTLPIQGDIEGALEAAVTAHAGFDELDDPFAGASALSVGILQMSLGRLDEARTNLTEANERGRNMGNGWLESAASTQLAAVAVKAGALDEALSVLEAVVDTDAETSLTTQALTFALVARAQIAAVSDDTQLAATALGAAAGQRQRVGLKTWPMMRRDEEDLLAQVKSALDPAAFDDAFAIGTALGRDEACALVHRGLT